MIKSVKNPEIEKSVLACIMHDNKCMDDVSALITQDTFEDFKHKLIYSSMSKLYQEGSPIDSVTLYEALKKEDKLTDAGGANYLSSFSVSSSLNVIEYTKILIEKWMLRKIQTTSKELNELVLKENDPFEILSLMSQRVYEIENQIDSFRPDKTIWGEFVRLMDLVEQKYSGKVPAGLMCDSFPTLNTATGGLMQTDLLVIYGKDKSGKTSLTERLILDFAFQGLPVGIFPMEIDFDTYAYKALSMEGNIEYLKLRNPRGQKLDINEFRKFYNRAMKFEKTKIFVDDILFDFDRMVAKAKLWKRKHKIGLFVFDYLGLIQSNTKYERRDLQLASYTGRLKNLAKELNTPMIVVSQANEDRKTADGKGAMRDGDFAIYLCKPTEDGIKSIRNKENTEHHFSDDEFLATVERSRHGKNKQNFVCGFVNNNFIEKSIDAEITYQTPEEIF